MLFTKKNKLFIFGDSFSFGHGCVSGDEYYEKTKSNKKKLWYELIAEEYDLVVHMYAGRGYSNPQTLRLIIQNLHKINKNDFVIIGLTDYYRFEMMTNTGFHRLYFHSFDNYEDLDNMKFLERGNVNDNWDDAVEYYAKYILYPNHVNYMTNTLKSFKSINDFLNNNSINSLLWTWDWSAKSSDVNFIETKDDWTINYEYNDIDDFHYSWYGHSECYKKMSNLLKNKIKFI